jgi:hypothetical protein
MAKGPGPYVNTVPAEGKEPIQKVVPFDTTAIGATPAGMPNGTRNTGMAIPHVGNSTNGT